MHYRCESGLDVVEIARQDRREMYISAGPSEAFPARPAAQVREVYRRLVDKLRSEKAKILYERIYADGAAWDEILLERRSSLERYAGFDGGEPSTVDGGPCGGRGLAGVQIWAVAGAAVRSVRDGDRICGRRFQGTEGEFLVLSNIPSEAAPTRRDQAERMFERAARILEGEGFSFRSDILRTWIYLDDILLWYDEFNRARSNVFRRSGITGPEGFLPASTGIGFRLPGGLVSLMDLLALRRDPRSDLVVRRCYNPLQNEAPEYGSAFTRGTEVTCGGIRTALVSGTAAIDEQGRTIHEEDARKQMVRTVRNIQALLEQSGLGWGDVSQGTLFVPSPALAEDFREVVAELELPRTPVLEVVGTVCRSDLRVEIEVTATGPVVS